MPDSQILTPPGRPRLELREAQVRPTCHGKGVGSGPQGLGSSLTLPRPRSLAARPGARPLVSLLSVFSPVKWACDSRAGGRELWEGHAGNGGVCESLVTLPASLWGQRSGG